MKREQKLACERLARVRQAQDEWAAELERIAAAEGLTVDQWRAREEAKARKEGKGLTA